MDFKLGDIKSDWDIVQYVKSIHYNKEDFVEGDIRERIEAYDEYELMVVSLNEIEEPQYYVDEDYVEEYKNKNPDTIPPIILGFYSDGTYLTIDGGHRITVAKEIGLQELKAYVATKSSQGHPLRKIVLKGKKMNSIEIEQLKNNLAIKVGILENKIKNGEINDSTSLELVNIFKEFEQKGTTIEELKLLFEDVMLALNLS